VVLLHGFTQTGVSWRPVLDALRPLLPGVEVVAPDLAGHGAADPALDGSDLAASAAAVAARCGRALYVGYSMGGRTALRLALDHPGAVAGLVLLGATAGIDDPAARAERRAADGALAARIEDGGVAAFLDRWLALPLFDGLEPAADDLAARRANRPEGLAASLRHAGTATMDPPWWDRLGGITAPTTVAAGERDVKFRALGERLAAGLGGPARLAVLAGCGHAAHLQDPAAFARLVAHAHATTP